MLVHVGCECRTAALEPCAYAAVGGEGRGGEGLADALKENALREQVTDEIAREARLLDDGLGGRARSVRLGSRQRGIYK
jgi:hypothetical protein